MVANSFGKGLQVSDVLRVSVPYRLYRKAITTKAALERRAAFLESVGVVNSTEETNVRLRHVLIDLREFIGMCQLDNHTIIDNTNVPPVLRWSTKHIQSYVFPDAPEPTQARLDKVEQVICENMATVSKQAKASELAWLLKAELAWCAANDWYIVFNTLTVDGEFYDKVFGSMDAWRRYIRNLDTELGAAAFGTIRKAQDSGTDYHRYFAVVERGSANGRLHLHVLHTFKALPEKWKDPNYGRRSPTKRQIDALRSAWPWGYSTPIAVRYSLNDAFGLSGWRWPDNPDGKSGLRTTAPAAVAAYVAKYVSKTLTADRKRSDYAWRVKKSRSLGKTIIRLVVQQLNNQTLQIISTVPVVRLRMGGRLVPASLLRVEALREIQDRSSMISLFSDAIDAQPRLSPLQRWRDSTRQNGGHNSQNTSSTGTEIWQNEDIFKAQEELDDAAERYRDWFTSVHGTSISTRSSTAA